MKQHAQNMDETTCCCSKYKIIHSYRQDEYKESNIPFDRHSPRTRILGNCKQLVFLPSQNTDGNQYLQDFMIKKIELL